MTPEKNIQLRKTIFWDVDLNTIDLQQHSDFIIQRIFERGMWDEVMQTIHFYTKEKVIDVLLSAEYLRDSAIKLANVLFNLSPEQYKCYIKKQLRPNY